MKEIVLNTFKKSLTTFRSKVALVSDEDFEYLNQFHWYAEKHPHGYYARTSDKRIGKIMMHRLIMQPKNSKQLIDHRDGDMLNNQRDNLRFCTYSQNRMNRKANKNSTSKYLGVSFIKKAQKWQAAIRDTRNNSKVLYLGRYDYEEDAAAAYNKAAKEIHGEFARLNKVPDSWNVKTYSPVRYNT